MIIGEKTFYIIALVVVFIFFSKFFGMFTGWSALAKEYHTSESFSNKIYRFQSAHFRRFFWYSYSFILSIGCNHKGLYLSVLMPFRFGHPPLLIPWSDIKAYDFKLWSFLPGKMIEFKKVPNVKIILSKRLINKIQYLSQNGFFHSNP